MDAEGSVREMVCRESDVREGELREVEMAGHRVLLVRSQTEFSAVGSKCPHAGAPLSKGVLAGNRLRCPWHGACFSIRSGDIEEYPTLDCLPCFKVRVEPGSRYQPRRSPRAPGAWAGASCQDANLSALCQDLEGHERAVQGL
nr:apoptosis-inducing factor 3-like [Pelodiscus sinensis]|eukprot:XP_014430974.1 apoptosis-inducing factor 3-like [Pelodiscus sinensis]